MNPRAVFVPLRAAPRFRLTGHGACDDGHPLTYAIGLHPACSQTAARVPFVYPERGGVPGAPEGRCALTTFDLDNPDVFPKGPVWE